MQNSSVILNKDVDLVAFDGLRLFMFTDDNLYDIAVADSRKNQSVALHYAEIRNGTYPGGPYREASFPKESKYVLYHLAIALWERDIEFSYLDIGAFVGTLGLKMAHVMRARNRGGNVYLYEPGKPFELVCRNVEINGLSGIAHPVCKAVGTYDGIIKLSWRVDGMDSAQIQTDPHSTEGKGGMLKALGRYLLRPTALFQPKMRRKILERLFCLSFRETRLVDCVTINSISAMLPESQSLFLKLDIEGVDIDVISDLYKVYEKRKIYATFEFTPSRFQNQDESSSFLKTLSERFEIYDIYYAPNPAYARKVTPEQFAAFTEDVNTARKYGYTDVLIVDKRTPGLESLEKSLLKLTPSSLEYNL